MYTVTPEVAVANTCSASTSASAAEPSPTDYGVAIAVPRRPQRRRKFGYLGCGLGLLSVFLVLFLCMARQPFLRLVAIDLTVDNTTKAGSLKEVYELFNDNYYSMSWHGMQMEQYLCRDENCDPNTAVDLGTAYLNQTIRQSALSTRRIEFDFEISARSTAILDTDCTQDGYFDLLMVGRSHTKLWMGGEVDVGMGPQLFQVDCQSTV